MKIRMISDVLKEQYGEKIYRLALSSGCTCPNRDGTVGTGGCTFCSEGGSGEFASAPAPVAEQIEKAKALVRGKTAGKHFIAGNDINEIDENGLGEMAVQGNYFNNCIIIFLSTSWDK